MNKKSTCRTITIITIFAVIFTVFAAFSGVENMQVHAASETDVNKPATVTNGPLNIRSGPGTNYKVLGTIQKGKSITVLSKMKNSKGELWYKYKYTSSKYGYLSAEYVKIKETSVKDKTISFVRKAYVKTSTLKVRSGPASSYSQLGTLKKGKAIYIKQKVTKSSGAVWYQFVYDGKKAYVNGNYVSLTNVVSEKTLDRKAVVFDGPLNVRSGPGTGYEAIASLPDGAAVKVNLQVKKTDGSLWYRYKYNSSKSGYISADYVELTNIVSESEFLRKGTVKSTRLIVRDGPGSVNNKIGVLKKAANIYITEKVKVISGITWYGFTYKGQTAYVNGNYVTLTNIVSEKNIERRGTVTATVNVRSGPHKSYKKLDQFEKGKTVTVIQEIKKTDGAVWYKFKCSSTQNGYIHSGYLDVTDDVTFKLGTVVTDQGVSLNVRSGPGTGYSKTGSLASGSIVTVLDSKKASNGKVWYKFQYSSSKAGWICSDYVTVKEVTSSIEFEEYMDEQGFPESYKPGLRALKAEHPKWVFKAYNVGCSWAEAVDAENRKPGTNVVSSSSPKSYRSKDKDCYNSKTGVWSRYDGGWYSAHTDVIKYYMDPRNFMNENGIYQFLTHKYDSDTQNAETVNAVVAGTFMETRKPGNGWSSFAALINAAGKNSDVNPNVLAAMIIQEQGTKGTSGSISGTVKGYKGYYNFLNVGAWTTSSMSAVERGLWYAKQQGWNTEYRSILGGGKIYAENYVERNQYTFYTKKFNVMNGTDKIATHQYMTNVQGAYGEGYQLKKAFPDNYNKALTFIIPVYNNMPSSPCDLP